MKVKDILSTMCGRVVIEHRCMIGNKMDSEMIVYYTRKTEPDRLPAAVKLFADRDIHKMSVSVDTSIVIEVHDKGVDEYLHGIGEAVKRGEVV